MFVEFSLTRRWRGARRVAGEVGEESEPVAAAEPARDATAAAASEEEPATA